MRRNSQSQRAPNVPYGNDAPNYNSRAGLPGIADGNANSGGRGTNSLLSNNPQKMNRWAPLAGSPEALPTSNPKISYQWDPPREVDSPNANSVPGRAATANMPKTMVSAATSTSPLNTLSSTRRTNTPSPTTTRPTAAMNLNLNVSSSRMPRMLNNQTPTSSSMTSSTRSPLQPYALSPSDRTRPMPNLASTSSNTPPPNPPSLSNQQQRPWGTRLGSKTFSSVGNSNSDSNSNSNINTNDPRIRQNLPFGSPTTQLNPTLTTTTATTTTTSSSFTDQELNAILARQKQLSFDQYSYTLHPDYKPLRYRCPVCGTMYRSKEAAVEHWEEVCKFR